MNTTNTPDRADLNGNTGKTAVFTRSDESPNVQALGCLHRVVAAATDPFPQIAIGVPLLMPGCDPNHPIDDLEAEIERKLGSIRKQDTSINCFATRYKSDRSIPHWLRPPPEDVTDKPLIS